MLCSFTLRYLCRGKSPQVNPPDHRLGSIKYSAHSDRAGAPAPPPPLAYGKEGQNVNVSDRRTEITNMDCD